MLFLSRIQLRNDIANVSKQQEPYIELVSMKQLSIQWQFQNSKQLSKYGLLHRAMFHTEQQVLMSPFSSKKQKQTTKTCE